MIRNLKMSQILWIFFSTKKKQHEKSNFWVSFHWLIMQWKNIWIRIHNAKNSVEFYRISKKKELSIFSGFEGNQKRKIRKKLEKTSINDLCFSKKSWKFWNSLRLIFSIFIIASKILIISKKYSWFFLLSSVDGL